MAGHGGFALYQGRPQRRRAGAAHPRSATRCMPGHHEAGLQNVPSIAPRSGARPMTIVPASKVHGIATSTIKRMRAPAIPAPGGRPQKKTGVPLPWPARLRGFPNFVGLQPPLAFGEGQQPGQEMPRALWWEREPALPRKPTYLTMAGCNENELSSGVKKRRSPRLRPLFVTSKPATKTVRPRRPNLAAPLPCPALRAVDALGHPWPCCPPFGAGSPAQILRIQLTS